MRRHALVGTWIACLAGTAAFGCGDDGSGDDDALADDGAAEAETGADADADADPEATPDMDANPDPAADGTEDGVDDETSVPVDPAAPGPFPWSVVDDQVVRGSRTTPVSVLIPDVPGGAALPLVLFLPGFQMRSAWYLPLLERIASHGFVVVRADPPASLMSSSHPEQMLDARAVLDWALDPAGPVGGRADAARVAASGHSAGGKIATMLAFADSRVTALLGFDPVNGSGPLGYTADQPDIVPDQVAPLAIPIGLLGETTDSTAGLGGQACAPAAQNFQTFYDAATSAPWVASWELLGADHLDFVYDTSTCGLPCSFCRNGAADGNAVRATVQTLAVAFLRRHLLGDAAQDAWLLGEFLPAEVVLQHRP